ncbi:MAG: SDR family oxidoreductase [Cytophagales bacterium]|nr:SDR family oxidoreductase [Cytophagales bacterium]
MKNYLIVGGSSGIGKELVSILATEGHRVYATYNQHPSESAQENVSYHPVDVTESVLDLDFLPPVLDGLVYCPGSINLLPFARIKPHDYLLDFELNVVGAIKVLQAVLPRLKESTAASVILFSTVAVQSGFNFHTQVSVSKGAIEGLTRSLAAELAPKIRVNAIAPSITDTPLSSKLLQTDEKKKASALRHPMKRFGTPADSAEMAAFLLSGKTGWVTGQIISVDGGISTLRS